MIGASAVSQIDIDSIIGAIVASSNIEQGIIVDFRAL